jgi:SKI/SNO/DAC family
MLPMMNQRLPHMPPHHGLGLLNSFMHHASPLDLMTAHHHDHPPTRTYNTQPSFVPSDPTENECKIVEYRGQKVAAFIIQGETMLCLPQAFDLFLKNLVGGLHTGYLSISIFCNCVKTWRICCDHQQHKKKLQKKNSVNTETSIFYKLNF